MALPNSVLQGIIKNPQHGAAAKAYAAQKIVEQHVNSAPIDNTYVIKEEDVKIATDILGIDKADLDAEKAAKSGATPPPPPPPVNVAPVAQNVSGLKIKAHKGEGKIASGKIVTDVDSKKFTYIVKDASLKELTPIAGTKAKFDLGNGLFVQFFSNGKYKFSYDYTTGVKPIVGPSHFTYIATDDKGQPSNEAKVDFEVENQAPKFSPATMFFKAIADNMFTGTIHAYDDNKDVITYDIISHTGTSANINDKGIFEFTGSAGIHTMKVEISDGCGGLAVEDITINVAAPTGPATPVNDTPVANDISGFKVTSHTGASSIATGIAVTDKDDILEYEITDTVTSNIKIVKPGDKIELKNGIYIIFNADKTYELSYDYDVLKPAEIGLHKFTYTATDINGATSLPRNIDFTVENQAPEVEDPTTPFEVTLGATTPLEGQFTARDDNGDKIDGFRIINKASLKHGTIRITSAKNGKFKYTPTSEGTETIEVQAKDSHGLWSAVKLIRLEVKAPTGPSAPPPPPPPVFVNVKPLLQDLSVKISAHTGTASMITGTINDPDVADSTLFAYEVKDAADNAVLSDPADASKFKLADGVFLVFNTDKTYELKYDFDKEAPVPGKYTFTFRVYDGTEFSDSATVNFEVENQAPELISTSFNATESVLLNDAISALDKDGDKLEYKILSYPAGTTAVITDPEKGTFEFTGPAGTHKVMVSVFDGCVTVQKEIEINVNDVPKAKPISGSPITSHTGAKPIATGIAVTDKDAIQEYEITDTVTSNITKVSPGTLTEIKDGIFIIFNADKTYELSYDYTKGATAVPGPYSFTYKATDINGATSNAANINFEVKNQAPVFNMTSTTFSAIENVLFTGTIGAYDPNSDKLKFEATLDSPSVAPETLTIDPDTGAYNYTGPAGIHTFTAKVTDPYGEFKEEKITIDVAAPHVNSKPASADTLDEFKIFHNKRTKTGWKKVVNDIDNDNLTYTVTDASGMKLLPISLPEALKELSSVSATTFNAIIARVSTSSIYKIQPKLIFAIDKHGEGIFLYDHANDVLNGYSGITPTPGNFSLKIIANDGKATSDEIILNYVIENNRPEAKDITVSVPRIGKGKCKDDGKGILAEDKDIDDILTHTVTDITDATKTTSITPKDPHITWIGAGFGKSSGYKQFGIMPVTVSLYAHTKGNYICEYDFTTFPAKQPGTHIYTHTASDGMEESTGTITLNIENAKPVITPGQVFEAKSGDVSKTFSFYIGATDPENDKIEKYKYTYAGRGKVDFNEDTGEVGYTRDATATSAYDDVITVSAVDEFKAESDPVDIPIKVTAPVAPTPTPSPTPAIDIIVELGKAKAQEILRHIEKFTGFHKKASTLLKLKDTLDVAYSKIEPYLTGKFPYVHTGTDCSVSPGELDMLNEITTWAPFISFTDKADIPTYTRVRFDKKMKKDFPLKVEEDGPLIYTDIVDEICKNGKPVGSNPETKFAKQLKNLENLIPTFKNGIDIVNKAKECNDNVQKVNATYKCANNDDVINNLGNLTPLRESIVNEIAELKKQISADATSSFYNDILTPYCKNATHSAELICSADFIIDPLTGKSLLELIADDGFII